MIYTSDLPSLTPVKLSSGQLVPVSNVNDIIYGITIKNVQAGIDYSNSIITSGYHPDIIGERIYATYDACITSTFSAMCLTHLVGLNNEIIIGRHTQSRVKEKSKFYKNQITPITELNFTLPISPFYIPLHIISIDQLFVDQVQHFFFEPEYNALGYISSLNLQYGLYGEFNVYYTYDLAR